ncbi:hypothetical protein OTU49_005908 [Cherax quadricarinatus]|uniref:Uncharacterized protein n=1 Tax=Cherax quadricarinatus TaxID=27406 RepID=A0AAW0WQX1_CHEQU
MGLRKLVSDDTCSYIYTQILKSANENQLKFVIVEKANSFMLKLTPSDNSVIEWSQNLKKTPQEYLSFLSKAVSYNIRADEQKDVKEDIFAVQEENLVWKQYFPKKNVYFRTGKFKLEKVSYEAAVSETLEGAIHDLQSKSKKIHNLNDELVEKSKKLDEAMDLAARSVIAKEEFEKEIYGKCAAIINAKKLRIQHLKSNHPSSTVGRPEGLVRATEYTVSTSQPSKKAKYGNSDSDCYDTDTDVDDPDKEDMDTDEENKVSCSTSKQKQQPKGTVHVTGKGKEPVTAVSSQDDFFNDSLEAELYPLVTSIKKQNIPKGTNKNGTHSLKTSQANKGKSSEAVSSSGNLQKSLADPGSSQKSIIDELF